MNEQGNTCFDIRTRTPKGEFVILNVKNKAHNKTIIIFNTKINQIMTIKSLKTTNAKRSNKQNMTNNVSIQLKET